MGIADWPAACDADFHSLIGQKARECVIRARAHTGLGAWDYSIDLAEWHRAADHIPNLRLAHHFLLP